MTHTPWHPPFRAPSLHFFSKFAMRVCMLSHQPCPTLCDYRTVARQAPLSMGFSRQDYWSGLPCPPPGDLPNPGVQPTPPAAPALQEDALLLSHWGGPNFTYDIIFVSGAQQSDSIFLNIMKWIARISLVTMCHHRDFLQDYWLYFLYVHSIPMTYFITGSLYLLMPSLFYISPYSLLLW